MHAPSRTKLSIWLFLFWSGLLWSGVGPHDRFTWFLEVVPAVIGFVVLAATIRRFRLTELLYWLILGHCIILMIGGKYTYAEVPLFNWLRDTMDLQRNHYDKVGHLAQGFVPVLIARELLLRLSPLKRGRWLTFLVICVSLAISALYELIEWWVALFSGEDADAFLGTQGYVWDTQSDMACALLGAIVALIFLSKLHDRQLTKCGRDD